MFNITCGYCQHTADFDLFATAQVNRYCCPACGVVWRIERDKPAKFYDTGLIIPATRKIVVESQMFLPRAA
jgi:hypothetical protein